MGTFSFRAANSGLPNTDSARLGVVITIEGHHIKMAIGCNQLGRRG